MRPVTLLIQDARRPLLGGLVDDGSLLAPDPPDATAAADRFRTLRTSPEGWMIGSFVVPVPAVDDLAGILIRTMRPGEAPWKVTVVFEAGDAGAASSAAAFHAAMDPAVSVDGAFLPIPSIATATETERSLAVARGIQPDTLPLLSVDPTADPVRSIRLVALARERTLQPAGIVIDTTRSVPAGTLARMVIACVVDDIPFAVVAGGVVPPVSTTDETTGIIQFGVLNLLAVATGATGRSVTDAAALLVDDGTFTVGFGGLDSPAGRTLSTSMGTPTRGPLLAIVTPDPDTTLRSLVAHTSLE